MNLYLCRQASLPSKPRGDLAWFFLVASKNGHGQTWKEFEITFFHIRPLILLVFHATNDTDKSWKILKILNFLFLVVDLRFRLVSCGQYTNHQGFVFHWNHLRLSNLETKCSERFERESRQREKLKLDVFLRVNIVVGFHADSRRFF